MLKSFPISFMAGLLGLAFLPGLVLAQQQLVINNEIACDLDGAVIDAQSGDIQVSLPSIEQCLGSADGLAVSPLLAEPSSVAQGDSFSVLWASVGAESCNLFLPLGWTVTGPIGTSSVVQVSVPGSAAPNDYTLEVICEDAAGEEASSDTVVAVTDSQPDSPPATPSLSRTILDGTAPGEVRLTWSSSAGATDCEADSNPTLAQWDGSVGTGSNQQVTLTGLGAGTYQFRLRCSNNAGSSPWHTVSATIGLSSACSDRRAPEGWTQMTAGCLWQSGAGWVSGIDCTDWEDIFPGAFHETIGFTRRLALAGRSGAKQYLAIEIDTAGMPSTAAGRFVAGDDGFAHAPNSIVSISSCPGDFHRDAIMAETGCYGQQNVIFSALRWGGLGVTDRDCRLESGRKYFLNIIPTQSFPGTNPDDLEPHPACQSGACGFVYEPQ